MQTSVTLIQTSCDCLLLASKTPTLENFSVKLPYLADRRRECHRSGCMKAAMVLWYCRME